MALKNVTITLEESAARWARIRAAEQNTSVSRLVGQMIEEKMAEDDVYRTSMETWLALPSLNILDGGTRPTREELYVSRFSVKWRAGVLR